MKNPLISFLASSILLFGCSSPKEVMYDTSKRAPTTDIEVFREGVKPEKPYKEIGEISFESFGGEDAHAMKELVAKAKALGAKGIVMLPRQETGYFFNLVGRSGNKYLWKAIAIVYQQ